MELEGSGAFRRPGSIVRVLRTERWVRPTERAGSEGSFICRCLGQRKPSTGLRPGGRRLAVRTTMEHPIGALPRTPFPALRDFPSRGNEGYEGKNRGVICFMYYSSISPFGGWRHHHARWEACHWILSRVRLLTNPVPLPPPQFGGAAKGKRLNGQARRLTSPHLEVLCRTSTVAL